MEDSQIIGLYWDRDQRAVEETAGKYGGFLFSLAWNILRVRGDAEECVNDVYLRAWNAMPPDRPGNLRSWLGRIARNLSLDRWKRNRARKRGGGMETLLGELEECVPGGGDPQRHLEDQEIARVISQFLRSLPEESRGMFLRRYWHGQETAEIALALNCGTGKVKSSLFRTRKALRAYLEKEGITL